jgi:hypothetical protein
MAEKTITINPAFFSDTPQTSRRKSRTSNPKKQDESAPEQPPSAAQSGVSPAQAEKANQLRKRLLSSISAARKRPPAPRRTNSDLGTFKEASTFFTKASSNRRNGFKHRTRRNLHSTPPELVIATPDGGIGQPTVLLPVAQSVPQTIIPVLVSVPGDTTKPMGADPEWGCLKQGKKPTYRKWRTMRTNKPTVGVDASALPATVKLPPTPSVGIVSVDPILERQAKLANARLKARTIARRANLLPPRRRTRKVGKHNNSLHVVVASRSDRANCRKEEARIKSTPMKEIDQYLIEKGLINYGNCAPDSLKRQMFEDGASAGGAVVVNSEQAVENILHM